MPGWRLTITRQCLVVRLLRHASVREKKKKNFQQGETSNLLVQGNEHVASTFSKTVPRKYTGKHEFSLLYCYVFAEQVYVTDTFGFSSRLKPLNDALACY